MQALKPVLFSSLMRRQTPAQPMSLSVTVSDFDTVQGTPSLMLFAWLTNRNILTLEVLVICHNKCDFQLLRVKDFPNDKSYQQLLTSESPTLLLFPILSSHSTVSKVVSYWGQVLFILKRSLTFYGEFQKVRFGNCLNCRLLRIFLSSS